MEKTKYTIYRHNRKEYLRFETVERYFFFFKKTVYRFIPRKHLYNSKGKKIHKWSIKMFPSEMSSYYEHLLISGNSNERNSFIEKYPHIQLYLNELNTFIKFY